MPVESEQAQAPRRVVTEPPEPGGAGRAAASGPAVAGIPAAPRPPHDEHELPDGRYLLAYRSAPDA